MDLDDLAKFRSLDPKNMIGQIYELPGQLEEAWDMAMYLPLPQMERVKNVIISGMGGSAIGADLLAAYAAPVCPIPIIIHRDYDLPAWAQGQETLVIVSSHSGNTEEALSVFEQGRAKDCRLLAITTGGKLAQMGGEAGIPLWQFHHTGQPRAAIGYSFGLLLAAMHRLGLLADPTSDLHDALHAMRNQQTNLLPEVPIAFNPAKRMAGQLVGRWVAVFAAEPLDPVARRWKDQINEVAKAWAQFEFLPEANHNTLAGLNNPESMLMQAMALFLQAPSNHPRNQLRMERTREIFMTQGVNTDVIQAKGESRLAHIWTLLHFGDYTSYYLAMMYGEDPTAVDVLTDLKNDLNKAAETK
jgi:glucose/mannose-6-phosphate isomerase